MTVVARMQLAEAAGVKCLCGHTEGGDHIYVLRRVNDAEYRLHQLPITTAEQSLRSLLSADQSESGELTAAILETIGKIRKPRKRKAKAK